MTPEEADNYVGAIVTLPIEGDQRSGKVTQWARDQDGNLIGTSNRVPILDTRLYEVEFPDCRIAEFSVNAITEHMYAQCDPDGNQYLLLDAIIDHQRDSTAVVNVDRYITVNGRQHHRKTTISWKLCVLWKDGTSTWECLVDLKESYPIDVTQYAIDNGIDNEPAFSWWVPYVTKKKERILVAGNRRYHKTTHKFGFEIPKTIKRALEIDHETKTTLWRDVIQKKMQNVRIAFKTLDDNDKIPPGYQWMQCHMIFTVKMDGFIRKVWLVAGGHMTDAPAVMTYASVVSRETVRIALTVAALNDLEVKTSDIQNAYLTAPCEEKIWTTVGPEFGPDKGKRALIVRALYGLSSAGASFGRHLADCMRALGYSSCKADADLWYKPMTRPDVNVPYYGYVLLYDDDCMAISHDAATTLREIDKFFPMKPGSISDPDVYLGGKLRKIRLPNGVFAWANSSSKYVQEIVANVEKHIGQNLGGRKLNK